MTQYKYLSFLLLVLLATGSYADMLPTAILEIKCGTTSIQTIDNTDIQVVIATDNLAKNYFDGTIPTMLYPGDSIVANTNGCSVYYLSYEKCFKSLASGTGYTEDLVACYFKKPEKYDLLSGKKFSMSSLPTEYINEIPLISHRGAIDELKIEEFTCTAIDKQTQIYTCRIKWNTNDFHSNNSRYKISIYDYTNPYRQDFIRPNITNEEETRKAEKTDISIPFKKTIIVRLENLAAVCQGAEQEKNKECYNEKEYRFPSP